MDIIAHQTQHLIGDFKAIWGDLKQSLKPNCQTICLQLYPELYLTGYPLQDLCLQQAFIQTFLHYKHEFNQWSEKLPANPKSMALIGGLDFECDATGLPVHIYNCLYQWTPGRPLEKIYNKRLLPNYDIFDEKKYFTAGKELGIIQFQNHHIGLLICEDMWPSKRYSSDPVKELANCGQDLHLVINLSASPYHLGKIQRRLQRAQEIVKTLQVPFVYVNRVGCEDEILFDGSSFLLTPEGLSKQAACFVPDQFAAQLDLKPVKQQFKLQNTAENSWESLFSPQVKISSPERLPQLPPLSEEQAQEIISALIFGLQEYAHKNGFKRFEVALSGGIDSALVLSLIKLSLKPGQELEAIFMAGKFSAPQSYDLSRELCQRLGVPLKLLPIKFLHSASKNAFQDAFGDPLEAVADENIQSRLRGLMLYARANQKNCMVLNTSNKSELSVGYSTQYGDSVGALSLLGDLYKTEVYQLARYINLKYDQLIPEEIIQRAPTAELREDQTDQQSLPAYERLDAMLEYILSYRSSLGQLLKLGFKLEEVQKTLKLYTSSEFKRFQFCPIIKLKSKSYGFGYRVPISKACDFYFRGE